MKVTLIAQASVLIETSDCKILTDPWFFGTAFNDSWKLFPEAAWNDDLYKEIDFLWISHEHPDHFHIPTLKSMPQEFKDRVTLLFQKNNSDKMPNAFRKMLGFKNIVLLTNRKVTPITPETSVHNSQIGQMDSSFAVQNKGFTVLNVNDCEINSTDCKNYRKDLGDIDLVLNQFSMAGYNGEINYQDHLPGVAKMILDNMIENHRDLGAKTTIPFASYVYFCCEDNKYINDFANHPRKVAERFKSENLHFAALFPGETYDSGSPKTDNESTLQLFDKEYDALKNKVFDKGPLIPMDDILEAFKKRHIQLQERFPAWFLKRLKPILIRVPDLGKRVQFSLYSGTFEAMGDDADDFDLQINSQPLFFALNTTWGVQTLGVSARYFIKRNFKTWRWYRIITSLNNAEFYLKAKYLFTRRNMNFIRERMSGGWNQLRYQLSRMKSDS